MRADTDNAKKKQGKAKRPLGQYKGQIWIAEDFDAPMELIESAKLCILEAEASWGSQENREAGPSCEEEEQPPLKAASHTHCNSPLRIKSKPF